VNPEPPKAVVTASRQIVNCLVEHVLRLEESVDTGGPNGSGQNSSASQRFVACVATLYLFAKIRPQLLVNHAITLQGYLSMRCQVRLQWLR
jgi:cohesin loading factor subunit SCC2